ncbi:hypothetical protein ACFOWU_10020 [Epilithonimonas zeae]|uniref:Uncharacterized protein n=1 Tax=Epilithonimonas zeae TaxID=1416779 RepID=A0A1N6GVS9_9FLAO|nr:hypothetical protein [Epilithonimonas zeae]SIO11691.1 hypothetical protein SAMN05444409_2088 [Epilithonimonas zeae]
MWYNIDIDKLALLLLPTFLRGKKMKAYLKSLIFPISKLYDSFIINREDNLFNVNHNGQKCYLRAVLNEEYDRQLRRIEIDDGNLHDRIYIYPEVQIIGQLDLIKNLGTLYIYSDDDYGDTGVDFYVRVPSAVEYDAYKIKYLIDFYKLATKRYKIITI